MIDVAWQFHQLSTSEVRPTLSAGPAVEQSAIWRGDCCIFQAIRTLSCEARNQSMYVVVNVPEVAPCDNSNSNCSVYYNSNVVFDRNGTIVARWGSSLIMSISITFDFSITLSCIRRFWLCCLFGDTISLLLQSGHYIFLVSQVNYDIFHTKWPCFIFHYSLNSFGHYDSTNLWVRCALILLRLCYFFPFWSTFTL